MIAMMMIDGLGFTVTVCAQRQVPDSLSTLAGPGVAMRCRLAGSRLVVVVVGRGGRKGMSGWAVERTMSVDDKVWVSGFRDQDDQMLAKPGGGRACAVRRPAFPDRPETAVAPPWCVFGDRWVVIRHKPSRRSTATVTASSRPCRR